MPSLGEAPSGGAERFWLLLALFPKVTRRKGGTISSRYRSNGYTHNPKGGDCVTQREQAPSPRLVVRKHQTLNRPTNVCK
jgi:hypothetical protein